MAWFLSSSKKRFAAARDAALAAHGNAADKARLKYAQLEALKRELDRAESPMRRRQLIEQVELVVDELEALDRVRQAHARTARSLIRVQGAVQQTDAIVVNPIGEHEADLVVVGLDRAIERRDGFEAAIEGIPDPMPEAANDRYFADLRTAAPQPRAAESEDATELSPELLQRLKALGGRN